MAIYVERNGERKTLAKWSEHYGLSDRYFAHRLKHGDTIEEAFQAAEALSKKRKEDPPDKGYEVCSEKALHSVDRNDESGTLCWRCVRDGRTCPWMNDFTPVEGWEATPISIKVKTRHVNKIESSFIVKTCPLFLARKKR